MHDDLHHAALPPSRPPPTKTMYWPNARQFSALRWIYVAYVMCYLVRKNYPMVLPSLAAAQLLSTSQAGVVSSIFEVAVGVVKFFCGVFVDRSPSPGLLLAKCLAVAGGSCLAMQLVFWTLTGEDASSLRLGAVAALWSANGAGQAVAWPALARVFLAWFPDPATRGTWYSILATNQNLGGVLAPMVYPPLIARFGWEAALGAPALLVLLYSGAMALGLRSGPEPAEEQPAAGAAGAGAAAAAAAAKPKPPKPGILETFRFLFAQRSFVLLSLAYVPVMLLRQSLINWTAVIFDGAGLSLFQAGTCVSALEFGGFLGGLSAGYLSDNLFGGRRGPVMAIFSVLCAPLSLALPFALQLGSGGGGGGAQQMLALQAVFFATGFASFPPHSLIGLMSREITPTEINSTAGCVAKATGQLGAAAAGWPLQAWCAVHGWSTVGYVNAGASLLAAAAFAPLWSLTALKKKKA